MCRNNILIHISGHIIHCVTEHKKNKDTIGFIFEKCSMICMFTLGMCTQLILDLPSCDICISLNIV